MSQSLIAQAIARAGGPEALVHELGPEAVAELLRTWPAVARPEQVMHPTKPTTMWLAGRGFGKTFSLSGGVHELVEMGHRRIAIVAPTLPDARKTLTEGPSGILAWSPRHRSKPVFYPGNREIHFWNGAVGFLFGAEKPERFRGPNFDAAVCDELPYWKRQEETWDMLQMTVRLGRPRWLIACTPRPIPVIRELIADPTVHVVRGTTFENRANLAQQWLDHMTKKYLGTRLGRQELNAELLEDNPGALWRLAQISKKRVKNEPEYRRAGVGVDPAVSANADSDDTGIVSAGIAPCRCKGAEEMHAFVRGDRTAALDDDGNVQNKPHQWAKQVIEEYGDLKADIVVGEVNQGGDLVESNLRANGGGHLHFKAVHATRGSVLRAEPVAALYEQGMVHHVGQLATLEDHMTQWNPIEDGHCPDDVTALVYILTELMLGEAPLVVRTPGRPVLPRRC